MIFVSIMTVILREHHVWVSSAVPCHDISILSLDRLSDWRGLASGAVFSARQRWLDPKRLRRGNRPRPRRQVLSVLLPAPPVIVQQGLRAIQRQTGR